MAAAAGGNPERSAEDAMAAAAAAAARNRRQVPPYSAPAGNPERPRVIYTFSVAEDAMAVASEAARNFVRALAFYYPERSAEDAMAAAAAAAARNPERARVIYTFSVAEDAMAVASEAARNFVRALVFYYPERSAEDAMAAAAAAAARNPERALVLYTPAAPAQNPERALVLYTPAAPAWKPERARVIYTFSVAEDAMAVASEAARNFVRALVFYYPAAAASPIPEGTPVPYTPAAAEDAMATASAATPNPEGALVPPSIAGIAERFRRLHAARGNRVRISRPFSAPAARITERAHTRYFDPPAARSRQGANVLGSAPHFPVPQLTREITDLYTFGPVIDYGSRSILYKVTKMDTGVDYACQQFRKAYLVSPKIIKLVNNQIYSLCFFIQNLDVVRIDGVFEDHQFISIVMELLEGKPLSHHLAEGKYFDEVKAAQVFKTILRVIQACHSVGWLHRGISPANFNLSERDGEAVIKARAFKLFVLHTPGAVVSEKVGNPSYWSPEVLNEAYGLEADVWSAGVLLYLMLCGVLPFKGGSNSELSQAIFKRDLKFDYGPWLSVSKNAIDLIERMLCPQSKRWTASQLLDHPWIHGQEVGPVGSDLSLDPPLLFRFREFAKMNDFKRLAMRVIATSLSKMKNKKSDPGLIEQEYALLEQQFKSMSSLETGSVNFMDLKAALLKDDPMLHDSEFSYLMDAVAWNRPFSSANLKLIAATLDPIKLDDEDLKPAFAYFADGHELIPVETLDVCFSHYEMDIQKIEEIFKDVDFQNEGHINYSEFAYMMNCKHSEFDSPKDTPNKAGSSHYGEANLFTDHPGCWIYCIYLVLYIVVGCIVYLLMQHFSHDRLFDGGRTSLADAMYFVVTTISTVGYGDVVPVSEVAKVVTIVYFLVGLFLMSAAFLVLSQAITNFEDKFCAKILRSIGRTCGRIWLSFVYCTMCIVGGTLTLYVWEKMRGFQPVYVSIASVTTLGLGDASFKSATGRLLGSLWLLPSTVFVLRLTSLVADWLISLHRRPCLEN